MARQSMAGDKDKMAKIHRTVSVYQCDGFFVTELTNTY